MRRWRLGPGQVPSRGCVANGSSRLCLIELRSFIGHTGYVNSVVFSPDGRFALSGSEDNTLKLWELTSGKEAHSSRAPALSWFHENAATRFRENEDSNDLNRPRPFKRVRAALERPQAA